MTSITPLPTGTTADDVAALSAAVAATATNAIAAAVLLLLPQLLMLPLPLPPLLLRGFCNEIACHTLSFIFCSVLHLYLCHSTQKKTRFQPPSCSSPCPLLPTHVLTSNVNAFNRHRNSVAPASSIVSYPSSACVYSRPLSQALSNSRPQVSEEEARECVQERE